MPKFLGIDYGSKRVGIAVTDETGAHVFPRETILNDGKDELFRQLGTLARDEGVERIVVGLPLTMRGERGPQATEIQNVMCQLEEALNIPVDFEDERMTSQLADRHTNSSFSRDSLAAAAILESYVERRMGR